MTRKGVEVRKPKSYNDYQRHIAMVYCYTASPQVQVSASTEPLNQNTKSNPTRAFNHHTVVTSPPTNLLHQLCPVSLRLKNMFMPLKARRCDVKAFASADLCPDSTCFTACNTWCFLHPQPFLLSCWCSLSSKALIHTTDPLSTMAEPNVCPWFLFVCFGPIQLHVLGVIDDVYNSSGLYLESLLINSL